MNDTLDDKALAAKLRRIARARGEKAPPRRAKTRHEQSIRPPRPSTPEGRLRRRERVAQRRRENPEKYRAAARAKYWANPDKYRAANRAKYAKKKETQCATYAPQTNS